MDMMKILGVAIAGAVSALVLKEYKPAFSVCVGTITVVVIFLMLLSQISYVLDVIAMVGTQLSISSEYIRTIIRIIGIAYIAHFGSALCQDAGQKAIAQKVELAGRILIVVTSIPILTGVLNLLIGILPA